MHIEPPHYYTVSRDILSKEPHPSFKGYSEFEAAGYLAEWANEQALTPVLIDYASIYYDTGLIKDERVKVAKLIPRMIQGRLVFNIIGVKENDKK